MIYTTYTDEEVKEMRQRDCGNCKNNKDGICRYFNEPIEDAYLPNCQLKTKTNYERIKNTTIDEMADMICNQQTGCECCRHYIVCVQSRYMGIGVKKWLESEVSTEGEETT